MSDVYLFISAFVLSQSSMTSLWMSGGTMNANWYILKCGVFLRHPVDS